MKARIFAQPVQEKEIAPIIANYWERAAFPFEVVPNLAKLNLGGANLAGYGCPGQSVIGAAMAVVEIARVDASMSTFLMVHNSLCMLTLGECPAVTTHIVVDLINASLSFRHLKQLILFLVDAGLLGSEEQKRELLPDMAALKLIGAWGLTEPSNGSDAAALQTTARKVLPSFAMLLPSYRLAKQHMRQM